jgi:hypothetical protein
MKKLFLLLAIGVFASILTACATVMRENSQIIPLKANVEKVDIKITNKAGDIVFEGQTPTTITLKTAVSGGYFNPEKYTVTASKDGFKTHTTVIDWHVSGWYWAGNFVIGGLIGYLIIDPITGDMYYLDEEVNLNMSPVRK